MSAFLSGEMKDTVQMNPAGAYGERWTLLLLYHIMSYNRILMIAAASSTRTVLLS